MPECSSVRLWIALCVVCGAAGPTSAQPEAQADLTMQASYLNVDDRAAAAAQLEVEPCALADGESE